MRTVPNCTSALLIIVLARVLPAQVAQANLSVVGGSATDVLGVSSRALTVAPSLSVAPDRRVALTLDGSGTRFDNSQWSIGAGVSAAARTALTRVAALSLNAGATATGTSYDFSYSTATALPALELSAGPVTGFVGMRAAYAATRAEHTLPGSTGLFGGNPLDRNVTLSASRSSHAALYGGTIRLVNDAGETMLLGAREERGTVDTVATVDRSVSLSVLHSRTTVTGTFGARSEPGSRSTFGSGALSFAMMPAVSLELNAGTYPANRLIGTPSGRFVNAGLSLRTGRFGGEPQTPKVRGVPAPAAGVTRLVLRDAKAQRVEVAGDFTNWKPITAARAENDVWWVDLRIPPGQYRYAFRVDGSKWTVPDGVVTSTDDFGGKSAWLMVSAPSSSAR